MFCCKPPRLPDAIQGTLIGCPAGRRLAVFGGAEVSAAVTHASTERSGGANMT